MRDWQFSTCFLLVSVALVWVSFIAPDHRGACWFVAAMSAFLCVISGCSAYVEWKTARRRARLTPEQRAYEDEFDRQLARFSGTQFRMDQKPASAPPPTMPGGSEPGVPWHKTDCQCGECRSFRASAPAPRVPRGTEVPGGPRWIPTPVRRDPLALAHAHPLHFSGESVRRLDGDPLDPAWTAPSGDQYVAAPLGTALDFGPGEHIPGEPCPLCEAADGDVVEVSARSPGAILCDTHELEVVETHVARGVLRYLANVPEGYVRRQGPDESAGDHDAEPGKPSDTRRPQLCVTVKATPELLAEMRAAQDGEIFRYMHPNARALEGDPMLAPLIATEGKPGAG